MPAQIDQNTCTGCENCTLMCPTEAIDLSQENKAYIDEAMCIDCGACLSECDLDAIDLDLEPLAQITGR